MPKVLVVDDNPELLALLSSALEDAGYTVQTAQRGRNALDLAKKDKPDVAIIDVLLPDVMGFDVADALRKAKVPFVFMSGVHKGGKAAANATSKYGAAGYFEKPFERKVLLEQIEKLVPARPPKQLASEAWDVESAEGVDEATEAMELTGRIELTSGNTQASITGESVKLGAQSSQRAPSSPGSPTSPTSPTSIDKLQVRRASPPERAAPPVMGKAAYAPTVTYVQATSLPPTPLAELLGKPAAAPPPSNPPPKGPGSVPALAAIAAALGVERPLAQSWGKLPASSGAAPATQPTGYAGPPLEAGQSQPPPPPPEALQALDALPVERGAIHRGELRDNLPQLFAAFLQAQETGELGLQRGQVKKIVYFEQGMPVFALSNLVADRLGQFLFRAGRIDEETLRHAAEEAQTTQQRTGDVLILMGLITEQERLYYVGQQIKSILYSLFSWEDGHYQMSFQERARNETIKLDLHPATLVMRGIKKLYKPERMQRLLSYEQRLVPSQDPLFNLSDVELQGWEAHVLARCDGTRTVKELLALSGKPEAETYATLVGLVSMKVLEVAG